MRKHATTYDAMAAAALARGIQHTDVNLDLHSATAAGVASHENPARFLDLRQALFEESQTPSLREQIATASITAAGKAANKGR
ncbi:hypothetical protein [uncultured Paludibaculum sp.]|uniref:hypothetical protein n=1 Tax=uncultured Paludibaculum sp. TaxID=1765020 RepID=UPI002AAAE4E2|nr:hypothetical protein [uncultured Paludibaculum sp.]